MASIGEGQVSPVKASRVFVPHRSGFFTNGTGQTFARFCTVVKLDAVRHQAMGSVRPTTSIDLEPAEIMSPGATFGPANALRKFPRPVAA
jgi:hypothetical protein